MGISYTTLESLNEWRSLKHLKFISFNLISCIIISAMTPKSPWHSDSVQKGKKCFKTSLLENQLKKGNKCLASAWTVVQKCAWPGLYLQSYNSTVPKN